MNNLDWLCENDREQLMKLLAEGDSCEYCAFEIEDDCGVRCNEGVRAWLEAEHSDGLQPENGVSDPDGGSNVAYIAQDTREKLKADVMNYYTHTVSTALWPDSANEKTKYVNVSMDQVLGWLDRQAAITKRDTLHDNPACSGSSTCAANRPISESADRKTPDTAGISASNDEIRDFDVWSVAYEIYCAGGYVGNGNEPNPPTDGIRALLDRQRAIAERECAERIRQLEQDFQAVKDDRDDCYRESVKLTVERDSLETRLSNCQDRIRQFEAERDKQSEHIRQLKQVMQADNEDCAQSFADMKVMENERDRARIERGWLVREVNGLMKNQPYAYDPETPIASLKTLGRYIGEQSEELDAVLRKLDDEKRLTSTYRRERDEFRKKLGDAVWHAQAIARITEVDW